MLVARKPAGARWEALLGACFLFAPIDRSMVLRARRASRQASQADDAEQFDALAMLDEMGDAMSEALIMAGVLDWKDVAQQRLDDEGEPILDDDDQPIFDPLPFSKENLAILLADPVIFDEFDTAYVVPFVTRERQRAEPGNGSSASPSGIGEAGTPGSNTAGSAAAPKKAGGVRRARTSSTKPKPSKKKASGRS